MIAMPPDADQAGGPPVHVRTATEADVESLFEIRTSVRENHQSREELARIGVTPTSVAALLRTNSRAWIAEVRGEPVAFSMANAAERTVFAMFVRPGHEGRGLGRKLMERAEEWLFEQGAAEIWLTTGSDPTIRANGFYRRLGWVEAGPTDDGQIRYIRSRGSASSGGADLPGREAVSPPGTGFRDRFGPRGTHGGSCEI